MNLSEQEEDLLTDRVSDFFKTSPDYRFIAWDPLKPLSLTTLKRVFALLSLLVSRLPSGKNARKSLVQTAKLSDMNSK